jgi:hypothetical protein
MKLGLVIRAYQDLLMHLQRINDLTGSLDRISIDNSSGRSLLHNIFPLFSFFSPVAGYKEITFVSLTDFPGFYDGIMLKLISTFLNESSVRDQVSIYFYF